ncbi:MAG: SpoIIE family protein phosphatase [Bacteroidota bacterium]
MIDGMINDLREKLIDKKNFLSSYAQKYIPAEETLQILEEIQDALDRMDSGTYGVCEVCGDPIEEDRLQANPLLRVCIGDYSAEQQKNLEDDLTLAVKIQRNLLPSCSQVLAGWDIEFHYEPASIVSGDYCDLLQPDDKERSQFVIMGDVSGKGVAASMLMTHLHAMFHTLVPFNLPVNEILSRMNRILSESTIVNQFATLVLAKIREDGTVEISNAGHCQPLHIKTGGTSELASDGIPLGVLPDSGYSSRIISMQPGDVLILYTDGLPEAMKDDDCFELSRILKYSGQFIQMNPGEIIQTILAELNEFLDGTEKSDDLTLMVLKKK